MGVRLAFATSNGAEVDEHFGGARRFDVYDAWPGGFGRVGARSTYEYRGSGKHSLLPDALEDVDAVFVAQVGQGAVAALARAGKRVFVAPGRIDQILAQVTQGPLIGDLETQGLE